MANGNQVEAKNTWKNCQVFEENGRSIIFLKYVVWTCHMIPTLGQRRHTT
jgi:hypothetical protein